MDKKQLLEELEKNMKDYRTIDEKNSMLMVALYQKTVEELKAKKISEIKTYFSDQLNYYEQSDSENEEVINSIIKEYTSQIDGLIKAYDYLYSTTYKNMQKAINNQMIAIGNIVTVWNKRDSNLDEDNEKIGRGLMALIQKKVNYSVIVEECKARLNWCIENVQIDMNEVFENKFYQLALYKNGFWDKLKRKIMNIVNGKKKFAEIIDKYQRENLKQIEDSNELKVVGVIATAKGVLKQIQIVESQIDSQYNEMVQNP